MSDTDDLKATDDEKIVSEAKKRFGRCEEWESHARNLFVEDMKFAHADSDNMYQWPNQLLTSRELQQRPTLTVNKTRIHCLQIINDAKQNKPGVVVHPTTNEASFEAAQVFEDVIRHIEYRSRAPQAYDKALENAVYGGIGASRVITDYVSADGTGTNGFDQELLIKGIPDPLTVYFDPDAKEADKSDGEFSFVYDDMPRDKFDREHPDFKDAVSSSSLGSFDAWVGKDHVRVAEYWRKVHKRKKIVSVINPETGERVSRDKDDVQPSILRELKKNPDSDYRERDSDVVTVECYKIAGNEIIERYTWAGKYIPIVPCIGEETVIDGQMDRKGHVRYLKDPQRMYNYNTSAEVEMGALQTKTPWTGPAAAFEGYEGYYEAANVQNVAFLPYKHRDDDGNDIPPPKRVDPPQLSIAFMKGMEVAQNEMMMASGQFQSQMGENENAKSGKAIDARQRQGDNATYHFVDNQAIMVRQIGRILVDMIPKIYDTKRLLRIRGEDGMERNIVIDPQAQEAVQKQEDAAKRKVQIIFNPNVGEYSVEADIGPSYATKRQEAWNAIVQILSQNKELIPIVGDLLFQNADFPGADEIARRLRRMAPPKALSDEPNPQDNQMQADVQKLTQMVQELNRKLSDKTAETNIKAFEAETGRLKAIGNAGPIVTPEQAQPLIQQVVGDMTAGGDPETFGHQQPQMQPAQPQLPPPGQGMAAPGMEQPMQGGMPQ